MWKSNSVDFPGSLAPRYAYEIYSIAFMLWLDVFISTCWHSSVAASRSLPHAIPPQLLCGRTLNQGICYARAGKRRYLVYLAIWGQAPKLLCPPREKLSGNGMRDEGKLHSGMLSYREIICACNTRINTNATHDSFGTILWAMPGYINMHQVFPRTRSPQHITLVLIHPNTMLIS